MPSNGNSATHRPSLVPKAILGIHAIYSLTCELLYTYLFLIYAVSLPRHCRLHYVFVDDKNYTFVYYLSSFCFVIVVVVSSRVARTSTDIARRSPLQFVTVYHAHLVWDLYSGDMSPPGVSI